mgnify:CR=1 FL=1
MIDIKPLFNPGKIKADSKKAKLAIEKATVSTLNKLGSQGITQGRKAITSTYNIKAKDVSSSITLIKANKNHKIATIRAKGDNSLPLFKFGGRPSMPASQAGIKVPYRRRTKASAKVLRGGKREKFKHAFVAKMGSNISIYQRTTGKSLPVKILKTMGVPGMFRSKAITVIDTLIKDKGQQIFEHELKFYLDRAGIK